MLATYLIFFHILLTGTFFGETPDRRDYLQAAAVAGLGGLALAAPMLVIGLLRRQMAWKLGALLLGLIGLAIAGFDLFAAASAQPPRLVPPR